MYEQTKALKEGKSVNKPIYNHVTGKLDAPEKIDSPPILVRAQRVSPAKSAGRNLCLLRVDHCRAASVLACFGGTLLAPH